MKSGIVKFTQMAAIGFALAFTFSCSSDDGNNNGGTSSGSGGNLSSPSGGGVPFNDNSQVYNRDGSLFTGSGDIKIRNTSIIVGSVANGIVNLQLPTIPEDLLKDLMSEARQQERCTEYPSGIKVLVSDNATAFMLTDDMGLLPIALNTREQAQIIWYLYASKAGKITCNWTGEQGVVKYNIEAKAGWNKIYTVEYTDVKKELSTDNILTTEAKWTLTR